LGDDELVPSETSLLVQAFGVERKAVLAEVYPDCFTMEERFNAEVNRRMFSHLP